MIERVYIKDYITFDEVELEFDNGLIVFTGPSGAGKSVLFRGILSIFGFFNAEAKLSEAIVDNDLNLESLGIEREDILIFKQIKKSKNRYFINNQAISRSALNSISREFISYLSVRDYNEFESERIIAILDKIVSFKEKDYYVKLENYKKKYKTYKEKIKKLKEIEQLQKESIERKEFLEFEIEKIKSINPREGEFEELMQIKKDLSKIEKLKEKVFEVEKVFEFENSVYELLDMLEKEDESFSLAMNELRIAIEEVNEKASFLENIDVEEVLNRLSMLQELIKRFGSINEALLYVKEKEEELERLLNLTFEKDTLQKEINDLYVDLLNEAKFFSKKRKEAKKILEERLNFYLNKLYVRKAIFDFDETEIDINGIDKVEIILEDTDIGLISTGEFNRLRVAFLAAKLEYEKEDKILFLDEVDANLSGEESMSVAEVLRMLAKNYQIFAISHQPQLASKANQHFVIYKEENKSKIKELKESERVKEIARIIGGKETTTKALEYAKELLKDRDD